MKKIITLLIVFVSVVIHVHGQEEEIKWTDIKWTTNSYHYNAEAHKITIDKEDGPMDTVFLVVMFKNDTKTCKHLLIEVNGSLKGNRSKRNYDIYLNGDGIPTEYDQNSFFGDGGVNNFDKIKSIQILSEEDSDKCKKD